MKFSVVAPVVLALVGLVACGGADPTDTKSSTDGTNPKKSKSSNEDDSEKGATDTGSTDKGSTKKADGGQCKASADCASDFCVFKGNGSLGMCTRTCDGDIDCSLGSKCARLSDAPQKVCVPE